MNKKIITSVLAVAFAFSMVSSAGAVTVEELQAQITALLAQITTLQTQIAGTGTGAAAVCFNTDLQKGMTSNDVMNLQIKLGVTPTSGYFGTITFAAVKTFQTAHGIINTGYVGPLTRAALNTLYCTPVVTTTTTVPPASTTTTTILAGVAGSVSEYKLLTSPANNREVGEGEDDVKVIGMSVEADEGSDIKLTAVRLVFDENAANLADEDFDNYATEVAVWLGDKEVARVDADAFTDDNEWSKTLSLAADSIIKAGKIGNLYVTVSGVDNLDTADFGETWDVDFDAVRFVDALGATISEDPGTNVRIFSFETFATAGDIELKLAAASDNPDEDIVEVDDADGTDGVVLLKGTLKAIGSDIEVKEMTVNITPGTGAANDDVSSIASTYILKIDGEEVQSLASDECDVAADCDANDATGGADATAEYTFDDVDKTIDSGDTVDFEILADVNGTDDYTAGDTLTATIDNDDTVAEDESGEDLADADLTGTITGDDQHFFVIAPQVTKSSVSITKTAGEDVGVEATDDMADATIVFKVKAIGGTIYINGVNEATDEDEGVLLADSQGNDLDSPADYSYLVSGSGIETIGGGTADEYIIIEEGETATFSVSAHLDPAADGFYGVNMTGLQWGTVITDGTTRSANTVDFGVVEDELETTTVYLDDAA